MLEEAKKQLALWLRQNKNNVHKGLLVEYIQERICRYANEEKTPAEQVKGMNRLLRDILELDYEMFEEK